MRKKNLLFGLLTLVMALSLSGCGFFASLMAGESDTFVPFPSEDEEIPEGSNYYRADRSNFLYEDLGDHSLYGQFFPNSLGEQKVLVIPVTVRGYEMNATELNRSRINLAFFGDSNDTGWESVKSYFYKSSFGQLNITGEVTEWFDCGMTASQITYASLEDYDDGGTYEVLNRAVDWAKTKGYDMKDYDLDKDGYIDAVWLVYSCPNYSNNNKLSDTFWAFSYVDYTNINNANVASPVPNMYAWASYDFMNEGKSVGISIDAHTYIHEHGHIMGLDDYYDYDELHMPLGGFDMQDLNVGDHNAFSKILLGWSRPYVVTGECTITIKPAANTGHCILVRDPASPYNNNGFGEYLLLELITPTGLWKQDSTYAYPTNGVKTYTAPGVRMMHCDGRLVDRNGNFASFMKSDTLYTHAYSNTPSYSRSLGTSVLRDDLLSIIPQNNSLKHQTTFGAEGLASNDSLFTTGDSFTVNKYINFFSKKKMHDGTSIPYTITFDYVNSSEAKITFSL